MKFNTETIFDLFKLFFPHFSETSFKKASKLEQAQWLYLLVYQARFELISHFLFGPYTDYMKSAEEFIEGLFYGQGGVCLERVMALKFLIELFEIGSCSFAMGGSLPGTHHPIDLEKVRLNLLDRKKTAISPYAHHAALIVKIQNEEWLLDANGGRIGKVFINPSLTKQLLIDDPSEKLGITASFGQMFYHRVPDELFYLAVSYRRGTNLQMLDLICLVGMLVGNHFDVFIVPQDCLETKISSLYPHRIQAMCWQIEGNLLEEFSKRSLLFPKVHKNDLFIEKIDSAFSLLNQLSLSTRGISLQMVLRIASIPWESFVGVSKVLPSDLMMR